MLSDRQAQAPLELKSSCPCRALAHLPSLPTARGANPVHNGQHSKHLSVEARNKLERGWYWGAGACPALRAKKREGRMGTILVIRHVRAIFWRPQESIIRRSCIITAALPSRAVSTRFTASKPPRRRRIIGTSRSRPGARSRLGASGKRAAASGGARRQFPRS